MVQWACKACHGQVVGKDGHAVEVPCWCAGRTMLDDAFPGQCWHAFIPAADATAQLATRFARQLGSSASPLAMHSL